MTLKYKAALDLQTRLEVLVRKERHMLNEILDLINEAEMNRSYLELGYPSLYDWLFDHFKYSETSARRRIDAAFLKRSQPNLKEKINEEQINLTNAARIQTAIRSEEARTQTSIPAETKSKIIEQVSGKSGDETIRVLMNEFPEMQIFAREKVRVMNAKEVTVQVVMSNEDFELFKRVKELLSHSVPDGSAGKIFGKLCREFVQRKDPLRSGGKSVPKEEQVSKAIANETNTRVIKNARYIPRATYREVFKRDLGSCQMRDFQTGKVCGSRYQVEVDHIKPFALGGSHEMENLRCVCAQHNRLRAEKTFGVRRA